MTEISRIWSDPSTPVNPAVGVIGPDDPTSVVGGVDLPLGSEYIQRTTGTHFTKYGAGASQWSAMSTSAGWLPLSGGSLSAGAPLTVPGNFSVGGSATFAARPTIGGVTVMLTGDAPTAHTHPFSAITALPATLAAHGITDTYTKVQSDANYPTKTGVGASGSWAINATGTAGSVAGWSNPPAGVNGAAWPHLAGVKADGSMEVGRYIDFHSTSADGIDYAVRLDSNYGTGFVGLTVVGNLAVTGQLQSASLRFTGGVTQSGSESFRIENTFTLTPQGAANVPGLEFGMESATAGASAIIASWDRSSGTPVYGPLSLRGTAVEFRLAGSTTPHLSFSTTAATFYVPISGTSATFTSRPTIGGVTVMLTGDAPTAHTQAFSTITALPTTLAGHGITDTYTKTQSDANYPTKAGVGATGSWGVSVTGTASNITAYPLNQSVAYGANVTFTVLSIIPSSFAWISAGQQVNYGHLLLGANLQGTAGSDNYKTPNAQPYTGVEVRYGGRVTFYGQEANATAGAAVASPFVMATFTPTAASVSGSFGIVGANASGGLVLNGFGVLTAAGAGNDYTILNDPAGVTHLLLGKTTDPGNIHRNTRHQFQAIAGGADWLSITSAGAVFGVPMQVSGFTATTSYVNLNRLNNVAGGIAHYGAYSAWQSYMAQAGTAGQGVLGTLTAPTGSFVTSWALRSVADPSAGYGWTWEAGASVGSYTPQIIMELSSYGQYGGYGVLKIWGDLVTRRTATTGVVYFGDSAQYLFYDGTNFLFSKGVSLITQGTFFANAYGHKMAAIVIGGSAPASAEDGTLWVT